MAPFAQQPDSVKPGSLLGPFEGQVVDADTQQPVSEAVVMVSWAFDRGVGTTAPEAARSQQVRTDVDGRYRIPALRNFPQGLSTRLARFTLLVYKKEYVAYRHDHVFGQPAARSRFAQLRNLVQLTRWSPELSHARHLLFVGGDQSLQAASWEVLTAAAELDRGRPGALPALDLEPAGPATAPALLDASVLLSSDEVRAVTGYEGAFTTGRLAGTRSDAYDSFHLRATDRPERYDVAVRIWRPGADRLAARYEELLKSLPGSKQNDEIGDRSFTVKQGEILGLGFLDRGSESVLLITCGRGQCSKEPQLLELGRRLEKNLGRLPAPPGGGQSSPLEPEEGESDGTEEDQP